MDYRKWTFGLAFVLLTTNACDTLKPPQDEPAERFQLRVSLYPWVPQAESLVQWIETDFESKNGDLDLVVRPVEKSHDWKPEYVGDLAYEVDKTVAALTTDGADFQHLVEVDTMILGALVERDAVCEVENEKVLDLLAKKINLPNRTYTVLAHKSPDARGIDVSFLVDTNVITPSNSQHQVIIKRTATRDLFWATMTIKTTTRQFIAIANHWPSRTAGQYESQPFRMLTGETLSFIISGLLDQDKNLPIIVMGDFNDEPFNRSMQEYARGTRDPGRVSKSKSGHLLNLMWPLMQGNDPGTYLFGSDWNMLDQFLLSKGMIKNDSKVKVKKENGKDKVAIFKPSAMIGSSGRPKRFGRPSRPSSFDNTGFSDHFPITAEIKSK